MSVWPSTKAKRVKAALLSIGWLIAGLALSSSAQSITNMTPEPPPYLFDPPVVYFEGGDGSSVSKAVVIKGAISTELGLSAEHNWVCSHHGQTSPVSQSLQEHNGRRYDVNAYERGTNTFTVIFDITDFYGKDHVGEWRCTFDDGAKTGGRLSYACDEPWEPLVSNRTAKVHYQLEKDCNDGIVVVNEIKNGKGYGVCKSWRRVEGTRYVKLKNDVLEGFFYRWHTNGVSRMWTPNGSLVAEGFSKDGMPWEGTFPESWADNDGASIFRVREGERIKDTDNGRQIGLPDADTRR